ncbi:hypothetical protein VTN00DRAFT_9710 [Thermoascus crustaceus]|uniref:uncharacterized protein n=1 Tax=Thermoascus crustaceus TaxID=5088 RepID=UPI003743121A
MPGLLDIFYPWPVVSNLASHLGIGDLLNLSRLNSECRAALHGFPPPSSSSSSSNGTASTDSDVRPDIYVGEHGTGYWTGLKSIAQMLCSELNHRKGNISKLCRYCSMPVCDACIVKESFAKPINAYRTRTRYLCVGCWAKGKPHKGRSFTTSPPATTPYNFLPGHGDFCHCTAKNGWICSACRARQCRDVDLQRQTCVGEGCSNPPGADGERRRVCLWCDLPLFGGSEHDGEMAGLR